MKKLLVYVLCSILYVSAQAQNQDSLNIVNGKWSKRKIAPKTYLKQIHFNQNNLFAANQFIAVIEIKRKGNAPYIAFKNEVKTKKTTSEFGKETGALASMNGTFFDIANGGSVDYIKIDGEVFHQNRLNANGSRAQHQQSAITITETGALSIKKWDGQANWESNLKEPSIMVSGPLLRLDNQNELLDKSAFTINRHPRTAVGIKNNGDIILLVVDGRHENSAGMSLPELQKTLTWLGCKDIINLDGGGSTTLWVDGLNESGVINYPADNKKWDHAGERKVANVLLLQKKNK